MLFHSNLKPACRPISPSSPQMLPSASRTSNDVILFRKPWNLDTFVILCFLFGSFSLELHSLNQCLQYFHLLQGLLLPLSSLSLLSTSLLVKLPLTSSSLLLPQSTLFGHLSLVTPSVLQQRPHHQLHHLGASLECRSFPHLSALRLVRRHHAPLVCCHAHLLLVGLSRLSGCSRCSSSIV